MTARRFFSITGTIVVGAIAGIASYTHMRDVAIATHQGRLIADLGPFSVDGLVLVATLAIGDGRKSTFTAWAAFFVGVGASLAANIAAADGTTAARVVSAWPSVAFLFAVEVLIRGAKKAATVADVETAPVIAPAVIDRRAATSGVPASGTHNDVRTAAPTAPAKARRVPTAAAKVASAARKLPDGTPAAIAAKAGVSESTARRHLAPTVAATPAPVHVPVPVTGDVSDRVNGHDMLAEVTS